MINIVYHDLTVLKLLRHSYRTYSYPYL